MVYREIHFDSRSGARSLGDNNKPTFLFNDPIYLNKYGLKTVQIPLSFYNCYKTEEVFNIKFYNSSNVLQSETDVTIPAGLYYYTGGSSDFNGFEIIKNQLESTIPSGSEYEWEVINGETGISADTYTKIGIKLNLTGVADANRNKIRISVYTNTIFARMIGYHPSEADATIGTRNIVEGPLKVVTGGPLSTSLDFSNADYATPPTKFQNDNYLFLRSDMAYGAHYLPNSASVPNYSMSDVLARIPIKTGNSSRGAYANLDVGTLDPATMFTYNGQYLDKATFWFTYADTNEMVDFRNKNFVFTLGIMTDRQL